MFGSKKGYIYFVTDNSGHIKIGVTESVDRRMKQLQTGNANVIELIHVVSCKDIETAYKVETLLHRRLKNHRVNGEWFEEKAAMDLLNHNKIEIGDYTIRGLGYPLWKIYVASVAGIIIALILAIVGGQ